MPRVLVTGSEGSLMQAVIPKLIAKGYEVYGVDNLMRYGVRPENDRNYKFLCDDLVDPFFVDDVFDQSRPDYVIQAAARIYGVGGFHSYRADILGEDISLHNNILKKSHEHGVKRVVFISSSMVYENVKPEADGTLLESKSALPTTDYGLSKWTNERLSIAFREQYLLPYTIWRPFNILTPLEKVTTKEIGVSHVFADFIHNIIDKKLNPLPIIGTGTQIRSFTWIDDVANAIADHSFSPVSEDQIFNLGKNEPIAMYALAKMIYDTGIELGLITDTIPLMFKTVMDYDDDVKQRIPNTVKAEVMLGWKSETSLAESIKKCLLERVPVKEEIKSGLTITL